MHGFVVGAALHSHCLPDCFYLRNFIIQALHSRRNRVTVVPRERVGRSVPRFSSVRSCFPLRLRKPYSIGLNPGTRLTGVLSPKAARLIFLLSAVHRYPVSSCADYNREYFAELGIARSLSWKAYVSILCDAMPSTTPCEWL